MFNKLVPKIVDELARELEDGDEQQQAAEQLQDSREAERLRLHIFRGVQKHVHGASLEAVWRDVSPPVEAGNHKARNQQKDAG